jgi:hypothetical protein
MASILKARGTPKQGSSDRRGRGNGTRSSVGSVQLRAGQFGREGLGSVQLRAGTVQYGKAVRLGRLSSVEGSETGKKSRIETR